MKYIHQDPEWPKFKYNVSELSSTLTEVSFLQGRVVGKLHALGLEVSDKISIENLSLDIVKSYEIEGEILNQDSVRSSIAKRLGVQGFADNQDRYVDGVVDMLLDATRNNQRDLTHERLYGWHSALFPTGRSGMHKIDVGIYRQNPMQIISGALGKEKIHYQAVDHDKVKSEMDRLINYFNKTDHNKITQSAIVHYYFLAVHPFDDGNGRIARALADMKLSQIDNSKFSYFSLSEQIAMNKKEYQSILDKTSSGGIDITSYIKWYCHQVKNALVKSELRIEKVMVKARFWQEHASSNLNERQQIMINKMFEGMYGKLTREKYCTMNKVSPDTGFRDMKEMLELGILSKYPKGGRSTSYYLTVLGPTPEKAMNKGMSM